MTTIQVLESIMQIFPEIGESQVLLEVDNAQNRFARKTRMLQKIGLLTNLTTNVSWSLPTDFVHLYEVELYNSSSQAVNKTDENIDWLIDNNRLIFYATNADGAGNTTKITTIPTSINSILVRYSHLPTALTSRSVALDIDIQFTPAVMYGALSTLYARIKQPALDRSGNTVMILDGKTRDYWELKFRELAVEAKRYMNMLDSTSRDATIYQDAGLAVLPQEAKDASLSTTNWVGEVT